MTSSAFRDLRWLADWFATSPDRLSPHVERIVTRLGVTALPLLTRELASDDPARRGAARDGFTALARPHRDRVLAALRTLNASGSDDAKVIAHALLSELGAPADVQFADPRALRLRSVRALAAQLTTAAELASAAELMIRELDGDDLVEMVQTMTAVAPDAAARLAGELALRLDLAAGTRDRVARTVAALPRPAAAVAAEASAQLAAVLVDAAARLVIVASASRGVRRHRRWAVLVGAAGRIEDCLHEPDSAASAAQLIARLCADGYRVASHDLERAAELVAAAVRRTAEASQRIPASYYVGRDLLGLTDIHLGEHRTVEPAPLDRAIELVAAGDHAGALPLLDRCDPAHPEVCAARATIHLARGEAVAAIACLERALAVEPDWPLHHWNLAAALHVLGDARGCYHALRRFVATSAQRTGLYADPDQPARVGRAERMMAELERTARLTGRSLRRRPRAPRLPSGRPARSRKRDGATP